MPKGGNVRVRDAARAKGTYGTGAFPIGVPAVRRLAMVAIAHAWSQTEISSDAVYQLLTLIRTPIAVKLSA